MVVKNIFTIVKSSIRNSAFLIALLSIVNPISVFAQKANDCRDVMEAVNAIKGINNKITKSQAVVLLKKYAENENSMAMNTLGMAYMHGVGVGIDSLAAINYLENSGKSGNPEAYHNLGMMFKDAHAGVKQNFDKAFQCFQTGVDAGSVICRYDLGFMYYKGLGCEQDYEKAATLFRQAADYDVTSALYMLGLCYRNGYGVEQNDETAKFYLERAGKLGYADAWIELQRTNPENYLHERAYNDSSKINIPSEMPNINITTNDINSLSGEYQGIVVMFDWSGKYILGEKPVTMNFGKDGNKYAGNLVINNQTIPFEANIDNKGIMHFENSQLKLGERYTGPQGVDYRMDNMKMEIWPNQISGSLSLYSQKLREPERPMYIELYRNGVKPMNSRISNESVKVEEKIIVAPNPFDVSFIATFKLLNAANNVEARFFNSTGLLVDVISLGDLRNDNHTVSISPRLQKGTYVLNIKAGKQVLRTIIYKK